MIVLMSAFSLVSQAAVKYYESPEEQQELTTALTSAIVWKEHSGFSVKMRFETVGEKKSPALVSKRADKLLEAAWKDLYQDAEEYKAMGPKKAAESDPGFQYRENLNAFAKDVLFRLVHDPATAKELKETFGRRVWLASHRGFRDTNAEPIARDVFVITLKPSDELQDAGKCVMVTVEIDYSEG